MDLRDYARTLRKHWQLVALCTLLAVAAAAIATLAATNVYQAKTQLFVSVQSGQNDLSQLYQGNTFSQQRVKSYADIVDSPRVTEPAPSQSSGSFVCPLPRTSSRGRSKPRPRSTRSSSTSTSPIRRRRGPPRSPTRWPGSSSRW